jgi:hypothetical protein
MTGRAFRIASVTVTPNRSRMLFCTTTVASRWIALTIAAFLLDVLPGQRHEVDAPPAAGSCLQVSRSGFCGRKNGHDDAEHEVNEQARHDRCQPEPPRTRVAESERKQP